MTPSKGTWLIHKGHDSFMWAMTHNIEFSEWNIGRLIRRALYSIKRDLHCEILRSVHLCLGGTSYQQSWTMQGAFDLSFDQKCLHKTQKKECVNRTQKCVHRTQLYQQSRTNGSIRVLLISRLIRSVFIEHTALSIDYRGLFIKYRVPCILCAPAPAAFRAHVKRGSVDRTQGTLRRVQSSFYRIYGSFHRI